MKKIISTVLPSLLIFTIICLDHFILQIKGSLYTIYIVGGIYLGFPVAFVLQGILCSSSINRMLIGVFLSTIAVILPMWMWYSMGGMFTPIIIYILLGIISYVISNLTKKILIAKR